MSLRDKVKQAYLQKQQGQRTQPQPQPQQPQADFSEIYLTKRLLEQQRPRRRIVQHEKKVSDILRDASDFLKG